MHGLPHLLALGGDRPTKAAWARMVDAELTVEGRSHAPARVSRPAPISQYAGATKTWRCGVSVDQKRSHCAPSRRKQGFDFPRARQTGSGAVVRTMVRSRTFFICSRRPTSRLPAGGTAIDRAGARRASAGRSAPADARGQAMPVSGFGTWSAQKAGVAAIWTSSASASSRASAKPARATLKAAKRSVRCWALAGVVRL